MTAMLPGEGENTPRLNILLRSVWIAGVVTVVVMIVARTFKDRPTDSAPPAFWIAAGVGALLALSLMLVQYMIKRKGSTPLATLHRLVGRFAAGDHSKDLVFQIEGILIDSFPETDAYDLVAADLAGYNPPDGRPSEVDPGELAPKLERAVRMLEV